MAWSVAWGDPRSHCIALHQEGELEPYLEPQLHKGRISCWCRSGFEVCRFFLELLDCSKAKLFGCLSFLSVQKIASCWRNTEYCGHPMFFLILFSEEDWCKLETALEGLISR